MDATVLIGGANVAMWGWSTLWRPLTGFPLAALVFGGVLHLGWLPAHTMTSGEVSCGEVVGLGILVDLVQYGVHRVMHAWHVSSHLVHHEWTRPRPEAAFYTGLGDACLQVLGPILGVVWVVRPARGSLIMYGMLFSLWLQYLHSSYPSLIVSPAFHAVHHTSPGKNFGHVLTLWDHCFRTAKESPH